MTQSRFFQLSLSFPIILWCLSLIVFLFVYKQVDKEILKNVVNGYRILVPYLIFAGILWKWASNRPYRLLILAAGVAPMVWGCFFALYHLLVFYALERVISEWYVYIIMAFWAMVVAYLFEIIPFLILIVFKDDFRPVSVPLSINAEGAEFESIS